jgi:hypothetical protein
VEKSQYELCVEILRRFHEAGVLPNLIIVGSWCVFFYRDYFSDCDYRELETIKTRDVDFLISQPARLRSRADIPELLKDLGFVIRFIGREGYIRLDHPELIIEFLVAEKGRGSNAPFPLPLLGVNAQPLRMMSFLAEKTIQVKIEDFFLTLPHPVNFALHKLLLVPRRHAEEKAIKDRTAGTATLKALISKGEGNLVENVFRSIPRTWQKKIINELKEADANEIVDILK